MAACSKALFSQQILGSPRHPGQSVCRGSGLRVKDGCNLSGDPLVRGAGAWEGGGSTSMMTWITPPIGSVTGNSIG